MNEATNYIRHLNAFFARVRRDDRLHALDISLYMALFQIWNQQKFQDSFPILRSEVISLCRIGSLNTYTKCLKHLNKLGYIQYKPSSQLREKSVISIMLLEIVPQSSVKIEPDSRSISAPPPVANLGHINKHINSKTIGSVNPPPQKRSLKIKNQENEKQITFQPPSIREVQEFFRQSVYPESEAAKFFFHYQANGWLQGGKTKIINWEAAAHKWVLSIIPQKDQQNVQRKSRTGSYHVNQNKSYSDPL